MHYQAFDEQAIREGVAKFGPAVGAKKMLDNEYIAADEAVKSGIYITYYCAAKKSECFRVGSKSKCFCGHLFSEHNKNITTKKINTSCTTCVCKMFQFIPSRPEECGMWWLPRRKDFNIKTWRPKCKCTHSHEDHLPNRPTRCKNCNCMDFQSDFACISCDRLWEEHEMLYETEDERRLEKKHDIVFNNSSNEPNEYTRMRPPVKKPTDNNTVVVKKNVNTFGGFEEIKSDDIVNKPISVKLKPTVNSGMNIVSTNKPKSTVTSTSMVPTTNKTTTTTTSKPGVSKPSTISKAGFK